MQKACAAVLCLVAVTSWAARAAEDEHVPSNAGPSTSSRDAATPTMPVQTTEPEASGQTAPAARRDPFVPADQQDESDGFVDAVDSEVPAGIRVRGIVRFAGHEPVAAIVVPGNPSPFFVREGEVVRIDTARAATVRRATTTTTTTAASQPPPELLRMHPELRQSTSQPSRPAGDFAVRSTVERRSSVLYLHISRIEDTYVEAYPKARPDDKQIFR
jgi:hypothetical protein